MLFHVRITTHDPFPWQGHLLDQTPAQLASFLDSYERGLTVTVAGRPVDLRKAASVEIGRSEAPYRPPDAAPRDRAPVSRVIEDRIPVNGFIPIESVTGRRVVPKPPPKAVPPPEHLGFPRRAARAEAAGPPRVQTLNTLEFARARPEGSVLLLHGEDRELKLEVVRVLKECGIDTSVIDLRPAAKLPLLDRLDATGAPDFAVVLLSADDMVCGPGSRKAEPRAGQGVIWGWSVIAGRLGGSRVLAIRKGEILLPPPLAAMDVVAWGGSPYELKRILFKRMSAAGLRQRVGT